ncbi:MULTISPECIES: type II toxin-antitoxin system HicA family toxin [unclassified Campylobacter]|uniref:type II toxin-antitoxin system HicA family toxin n=1 Tax=unclassified Campylobacter TaxID=2593542 RepID=UPI001473EBFB|nr:MULTISPECIES: type II toxin-antitoxin system HicA family toxin [unclassified Campylobacter]QKG29177.1 putative YcfA family protein [Campylobacter sp. RM16187]
MGSLDKLISKLANNPKNASFEDLQRILINFGWELEHARGSHHKFKKDKDSIIIPRHKPIKEVYTLAVLEKIGAKK